MGPRVMRKRSGTSLKIDENHIRIGDDRSDFIIL